MSVFASTDLDKRMKTQGIDTLLITGLMAHACVAEAARDAVRAFIDFMTEHYRQS